MPPPLKGIKIVDLTRILAGPTATMLLADLVRLAILLLSPPGLLAHADADSPSLSLHVRGLM